MREKPTINSLRIAILVSNRAGMRSKHWAEHGFSAVLDCNWDQWGTRRILFDTATSGDLLMHNLQAADISPGSIDLIFLSHGHGDHTGGLASLTGLPAADFTLVAHPTITRQVISTRPELQKAGMDPQLLHSIPAQRTIQIQDPVEIYPHVYSTGSIPRTTDFEQPREDIFHLRDGKMIPDDDPDDMALIFDLGSTGLTVITGCCHAGLVNTLLHAEKITANDRVHCILGGLHLVDADDQRLQQTASHLQKLHPQAVYTGHCTGEEAELVLRGSLDDAHHLMKAGLTIELPHTKQH